MRRRISCCSVILLIFLFSAITAMAQGKPKISVKSGTYDFGAVTEGSKVEHEFLIANEGTADLTIQRVVAACGCTTANVADLKVTPGTTAPIKVAFDSAGFSGTVQKAVRVYSDDPAQPIAVLSLNGSVSTEISVEPRTVVFEKLNKENIASQKKSVVIAVNRNSPITIEGVNSYSKFLKIEELESTPQQRKISVSLTPDVPAGQFRDRLIVNLKGGARNSVNVPILASVGGVFTFEPPAVSFGLIKGSELMKRRAKLESSSQNPLKLGAIQSNHPAVTASITPIMEGRSYWIDVTLDPAKVNRDLRASVKLVNSGSDSQEELSLNVYGVLAPKAAG